MTLELGLYNPYWEVIPPASALPTFTPLNVTSATLVCYIDAENDTKITNVAGACSQIIDTADPTGIYVQATAANRPLIQPNSLTGRQVLQFDGVNDTLRMATYPALLPLAGVIDFWIIGTQEAGGTTNPQQYSYGTGLNTGSVDIFRLGSTGLNRFSVGNGTSSFSTSGLVTGGLFIGATMSRGTIDAGALMKCEINGCTPQGAGISAPGWLAPVGGRATLGGNSSVTSTGLWTGAISAVCIFSSILSQSDYNSMLIWSAQRLGKYG
jgi:hypothetical protein